MSQILQSKLNKVQKDYVEQLDAFLNVNMNDIQVKNWTVALSKYNEDVLREGWNEFVYQVRPGLMPSITDCTKIMDRIRLDHNREIHNAAKAPIERTEDNAHLHDWIAAIRYGLNQKREGKWNEGERLEYMLDIAKEIKLDVESIDELEIDIARWRRNNPDVETSPI
jgi:hypothetical protein